MTGLKKAFRSAANRADPIFGNIFPASAGSNAAVGIAFGFVVNVFAFHTGVFFIVRHSIALKKYVY